MPISPYEIAHLGMSDSHEGIMKNYIGVFLIAITAISSCGVGLFNTSQMVDYKTDKNGNLIQTDSPKNWDLFATIFNNNIQFELSKRKPGGGVASWNVYWTNFIRRIRDGGFENPQRNIDYIISQRRKAGLPALK